ncbi:MAG TPA: hypothetical protein VHO68_07405 [Bacteroidales bacterium]|nr:hypothetical protein [Bacteroidales bacterium]
MKKKSFEEKQLDRTMCRIGKVAKEIGDELNIIYEELERKGRWNEFMKNIDNARPKKGPVDDVAPENYYETLHFAFHITDKFDDLSCEVELNALEDFLLTGKGIDTVELPEKDLKVLKKLGIRIEGGVSNAHTICNPEYEERICIFLLKSRHILELTRKALRILRESKAFIFLHYN